MCYDLLGASVFRCVLLGTRRCGVSRVFTLVCHVLVISYCKHVLWWSGWLYLCKCGRVCDKETASGCVWRWRTSPQGVLFLVLHAHGQRCPLWDLWRWRRWKEGGREESRGERARGQGWAGVHQNSVIKHALEGVSRWGLCMRVCVGLACISRGGEFAEAWQGSLKSTHGEMDWTASPMNPDC